MCTDRSEDFGREDDKQLFEQQGLSSDLLLQGDSFYNSSYVDQYEDLGMGVGDYGYPDDLEEELPDLDPKEIELGERYCCAFLKAKQSCNIAALQTEHAASRRNV